MLGTIPESHEGEAKKQTEGSPKLGHEGGEGVYELLHLHPGELRQGAEGEGEVVWGECSALLLAEETVPAILARLQAACQLGDTFLLHIAKILV